MNLYQYKISEYAMLTVNVILDTGSP